MNTKGAYIAGAFAACYLLYLAFGVTARDKPGFEMLLLPLALLFLANVVAQNVFPTFISDAYGKRVSYRVTCAFVTVAILGIMLGVWWVRGVIRI